MTEMKMGDEIPVPTAADIEAVLTSIKDGTSTFGRWLELDRADEEADRDFGETCVSEVLGRTLWWAEPIDPSNIVDEDAFACGHTPAEAAAAAWVHHCFGGLPHWPTNLSEDEYLSFPRHVPEGWAFDLYDVPDKARKTRQQFASFARTSRVAGQARAVPGRSPAMPRASSQPEEK